MGVCQAYPKNSPEGSEDFYDCFLFEDARCNGKNTDEEYEKFVRELMGYVIGVDIPAATNMRNEKLKQVHQSLNELYEIVNIIATNL